MYLTEEPLDLGALLGSVHSAERGGSACFLGTVRNHHQGRAVLWLEYSSYAPMVEAECARILAEAEARWPVTVALRHRIGRLEIGDAAVAVAAASAHRDDAFAGCRYVIEQLKRRVPIWKREYYADGTVEWVAEAGKRVSGEAGKQGSRDHKGSTELASRAEGTG